LARSITINLIIQTYFQYAGLYSSVINDFNSRYAKEHNLDIDLQLHLFTEANSTVGEDFYSSTISTLLNKKTSKYDVFIYDPLFTRRYYPYFVDLKEYLPEELMALYSSTEEARQSGFYNGKWVGLVR